MKFKNERSLEQSLARDFPGSKNVLEALQKVKLQRLNQTALQTPLKEPITEHVKYLAMHDAIKSIEKASIGFDFNTIPPETTASLAKLPLTTIEEAEKWRDAWLKTLNSLQSSK